MLRTVRICACLLAMGWLIPVFAQSCKTDATDPAIERVPNPTKDAVGGTGSSVAINGNSLTLTPPITFAQSFAGNRIFFLAARSNSLNSDWQAVGSVAVPWGLKCLEKL